MTDHLPECIQAEPTASRWPGDCICDRLRACEQRVEQPCESYWTEAYLNALDAARDAVAALPSITLNSLRRDGSTPSYDVVKVTEALAAIDALRGDA